MNDLRRSHDQSFIRKTKHNRRDPVRPTCGDVVTVSHVIQDRIRSTDLHDHTRDELDDYISMIQFGRFHDYVMPYMMARRFKEFSGVSSRSRLVLGMSSYLHDAFISRFSGADDVEVIVALHCVINLNMLALCFLYDYDKGDSWFIYTTETLSGFEQSPGTRYILLDETKVYIRPSNDVDRQFKMVGPTQRVNEYITGVVDMCCTHGNPDVIVFGAKQDISVTINGNQCMSYQHTDTPISRTYVPHYRIGPCRVAIRFYDLMIEAPTMLYKAMKALYECSNGLRANNAEMVAYLPRPYDLGRFSKSAERCYVSPFIGVIYMIVNNLIPTDSSMTNLFRYASSINKRISDVTTSTKESSLYVASRHTRNLFEECGTWKNSIRELFDI